MGVLITVLLSCKSAVPSCTFVLVLALLVLGVVQEALSEVWTARDPVKRITFCLAAVALYRA
jgi:hypothetical protein